jgi:hypothetical protein
MIIPIVDIAPIMSPFTVTTFGIPGIADDAGKAFACIVKTYVPFELLAAGVIESAAELDDVTSSLA